MTFYGAIEQLLSGWIFGLIPAEEADYERAKTLVVEAICGTAPLSIDAWTEKPDATRCQAIAAVVRDARR